MVTESIRRPCRPGSPAWAVPLATLPADLRSWVAEFKAVHETGQQRRGAHKDQLVVPQHEVHRSTVKPVIWRHPRTGRELLYVSQQMTAGSRALTQPKVKHCWRSSSPTCIGKRPYSITSGSKVTWWYGTTSRCNTLEATWRSRGRNVRCERSLGRNPLIRESRSRRWCEPERNNRPRRARFSVDCA